MNNSLLRLKIMIACSSPEEAGRLQRMLGELDCDILVASNVAEARECILLPANIYNPVDVAIIDYFIPGTDGVKLGKQLKELDPHLELILLTSDKSREVWKEILVSGIRAAGLVARHEDIAVLISVLQYVLANKRCRLEQDQSFVKERAFRYGKA